MGEAERPKTTKGISCTVPSPVTVVWWLSRRTLDPEMQKGRGSNPGGGNEKKNSSKALKSHDLGVARLPKSVRSVGPKHLIEGGFFSEDFLLLLYRIEFLVTDALFRH